LSFLKEFISRAGEISKRKKVAKRRATLIMTNEGYPSTLGAGQHFKSDKSNGKVDNIQKIK